MGAPFSLPREILDAARKEREESALSTWAKPIDDMISTGMNGLRSVAKGAAEQLSPFAQALAEGGLKTPTLDDLSTPTNDAAMQARTTWMQTQQAQPTPSGTPSAMPGQPPRTVDATIQDGRTTPPSAGGDWRSMPVQRPMNADTPPATGDIDNSSRESFVRTAWPYMLQAANGDQNLAELMMAKAISENGSIGTGRPFWANNFSGIKGEGDAGSVEADTWEDYGNGPVNIRDRFAVYSTPQAGMAAFMDFLRNNSRYHGALARYQQTGNADALFDDILAAGYATDKQWANKVRSIRDTQVAPIVRQQQAADPRQSSMSPNAAAPSPVAASPSPAASAGPASSGGGAGLPPSVVAGWRQMYGRDPDPQEAQELMTEMARFLA